jgi:hypothetical protein
LARATHSQRLSCSGFCGADQILKLSNLHAKQDLLRVATLAACLAWLALSHGDAVGCTVFDDAVRASVPARAGAARVGFGAQNKRHPSRTHSRAPPSEALAKEERIGVCIQ